VQSEPDSDREFQPGAGVANRKLGVCFAERSARLARRTDEGIPGVFGGGPTPPASARAGETGGELPVRDTEAFVYDPTA